MTAKQNPSEVTLGSKEHPVRFHFLYAHKPREEREDDEAKGDAEKREAMYQTMVLVPKAGGDKTKIEAAMRYAAANDRDTKGQDYESLDLVLRDGDDPKEQAKKKQKGGGADYLKGHWFFNCKSKNKPQVVGTKNVAGPGEKPKFNTLAEDEIKWGDKGRIVVRFYGYRVKGKCGIAASMGNIQKLFDGDPLGNSRAAEDQFEMDTDQDDDFMK